MGFKNHYKKCVYFCKIISFFLPVTTVDIIIIIEVFVLEQINMLGIGDIVTNIFNLFESIICNLEDL